MNGQIVNDEISTPHDQFEDIRKSALPDNSVKIHSTNLSVLGIALNALAALMLAMNTRAALVNLDILKNCYDQRNDKERNCGRERLVRRVSVARFRRQSVFSNGTGTNTFAGELKKLPRSQSLF